MCNVVCRDQDVGGGQTLLGAYLWGMLLLKGREEERGEKGGGGEVEKAQATQKEDPQQLLGDKRAIRSGAASHPVRGGTDSTDSGLGPALQPLT